MTVIESIIEGTEVKVVIIHLGTKRVESTKIEIAMKKRRKNTKNADIIHRQSLALDLVKIMILLFESAKQAKNTIQQEDTSKEGKEF